MIRVDSTNARREGARIQPCRRVRVRADGTRDVPKPRQHQHRLDAGVRLLLRHATVELAHFHILPVLRASTSSATSKSPLVCGHTQPKALPLGKNGIP